MSQWDDLKKEIRENAKGFGLGHRSAKREGGSSGWIRTSNPPVNSCIGGFFHTFVQSDQLSYGQ